MKLRHLATPWCTSRLGCHPCFDKFWTTTCHYIAEFGGEIGSLAEQSVTADTVACFPDFLPRAWLPSAVSCCRVSVVRSWCRTSVNEEQKRIRNPIKIFRAVDFVNDGAHLDITPCMKPSSFLSMKPVTMDIKKGVRSIPSEDCSWSLDTTRGMVKVQCAISLTAVNFGKSETESA